VTTLTHGGRRPDANAAASAHRSPRRGRLLLAAACLVAAVAIPAATARADSFLYAAPGGSGTGCSASSPCSLPSAQQQVRTLVAGGQAADVTVELADGTYRLDAPLRFDASDSGRDGHRVIWTAQPGARPVLSGAVRVTGWQLHDAAKGIWEAPVPADLETRQIYVDGKRAPIAQTTPAEQLITRWAANGTVGQTTTPTTWGQALQAQIGASALRRVELVWTGGNGAWTQPRCRIDSAGAAGALVYQQPCWRYVTSRPTFSMPSGGLPNMSRTKAPNRIENAYAFLHPGQWFLDLDRHVLDYIPLPGQDMATLDVEAPRLTSLVTGSGSAGAPVADITFRGLQFSYATWNDPSAPAGWAEVQDNLRFTSDDPTFSQFVCTFGNPAGLCPFGSLTREPANVQFSWAHDLLFQGDVFTHLGAAGLGLDYGSQGNTIEGNVVSDISGIGIQLGDTLDPHPSDVAGADDREINAYNTIDDNVIHDVGADYPSAAGMTVFFSRHTTITHNDLYDLPYTGISIGVVQGHVDNSSHPDNTTNINSDNTISFNLFHDFVKVLQDGGAIYVEGHQSQHILNADGTVDSDATLAHGLRAEGNVAYNQVNPFFVWYDDAGAEWIDWTGNVEWAGSTYGQGGCEPNGHIWYTANWSADRTGIYNTCSPQPIDTHASDNIVTALKPGAADLPLAVVGNAGVTGSFRELETGGAPTIRYQSPATGIVSAATSVFVAGNGYSDRTRVSFGGIPATAVSVLSPGFLVATAPAGTDVSALTLTGPEVDHGAAGGTVPATLSLALGAAAGFGTFTPGVTRDYDAATTANVISTAGDALLNVLDPGATAPGHLVNGAFSLPSALQASASSAAGGAAGSLADVGGAANPTPLLTYAGPASNDGVTVAFRQHIGATDPLRTGTYAKTLTFTLSTTTP
jgi:hypothetical protein